MNAGKSSQATQTHKLSSTKKEEQLRLLHFACLLPIVVSLGGCFYTEPIIGDDNTYFVNAMCQCLTCDQPGEDPEFCSGPVYEDTSPVVACGIDYNTVGENYAIVAAACARKEDNLNAAFPGRLTAACALVPVYPGEDIQRYFEKGPEKGVCRLSDVLTQPGTSFLQAPHSSRGAITSSVFATNSDLTLHAAYTGDLAFTGGNCSTGSCPIEVSVLSMRAPSFEAEVGGDTQTFEDAVNFNRQAATGTCYSLAPLFNACAFLFDPGTFEMDITAVNSDGTRLGITVVNTQGGGGILNFDTREVSMTQVFDTDDTTVDLVFNGTIENFAPRATLPAPSSVACGIDLEVVAEIEDVDGPVNALTMTWWVDGAVVQNGGSTLVQTLSPGAHDVDLVVRDAAGGRSQATTTLTVLEDVTPPQIAIQTPELCLWPPDHKYAVLTSEDVAIIAVDDCDPNPTVTFAESPSSPPNADIVVQDESICVRVERDGTELEGRTYNIAVRATDASGNTGELVEAIMVDVPHDQGTSNDCTVYAGSEVDPLDPRCIEPEDPEAPSGASASSRQSNGGCTIGGDGDSNPMIWFLCFLAVTLSRRRKQCKHESP